MNNWKLRCFSARNRVIKHQPFGVCLRLEPDASDVGAQHAAPKLARTYKSTHSLLDFLRGRNNNHSSTGPPLPFRCTVSTQVTMPRMLASTKKPPLFFLFLRGERTNNPSQTAPPLPFRCTVSTQVTMPREPPLCQFGLLIFVCDGDDLRTTEDCPIVGSAQVVAI